MMSDKLRETQVDSTLIHKGSFFTLFKDKVLLPNQQYSYREYITHPKAAVVVPVFENGDILLIKQFRYPLKEVFIELPAGKVDSEENLDNAARRELLEETGYEAKTMKWICQFFPCMGYSDEEMHLYLAKGLSLKEQQTDHDEFIEPLRVSYQEAIKLIESGQIKDLKTIAGLYRVQSLVTNE